jgi:hypothetical protein
MSPVVGPPGWQRPAKGTRIALGSNPAVSAEAVGVVFSESDARPVVVDEIDAAMGEIVQATTRRLAGDEFSAQAQRRAGAPPPSQRMLQALRDQQAQKPATAEAINLESLSNEELRKLDDAVTERMSAKGLYAYDAGFDEDDDVADYAQIEDDSSEYIEQYTQQGAIEGAL